jgi:hypothetical protein
VAQPSSAYEPRDPTSTILHGIVRDHFETFRAHAASLRDGEGLPRFVEQEFRDFLRCGCLAGGFAPCGDTREDVAGVVPLIARRLERLLERRGPRRGHRWIQCFGLERQIRYFGSLVQARKWS